MRIGLDLGGTKIAALALSGEGQEVARARTETPKDYAGIIRACTTLVHGFDKELGVKARVGIGAPGVIDGVRGIIRFSPNIPVLAGRPFADDLAAALGRPVRLANDAQCFALSESVDGAGKDAAVVYGVILGTGVGGGLVVNRQLPHGPNAMKEWGHVPLPWAAADDVPTRCGCGRLGCVESYLSGPALHRQLHAALGYPVDNMALQQGIAQGDPAIMAVMDVYITRLAKALAMLATILDPDALVLGGGVSNLDLLYSEVPRRWGAYTVIPDIRTQLLKAHYGDDSGLRGAAWLWQDGSG